MSGATAECTWGDGPDVLVSISRESRSGYGLVTYTESESAEHQGSFGLTSREARALAGSLKRAADRADKLERDLKSMGAKR